MDSAGERYGPLVHRSVHHGAALWVVGVVQFVVAMAVAQLAYGPPTYSLTQNYISDLGAIHCASFPLSSSHYVCSPGYLVFDASAVALGTLLILGALLLPTAFPARASRRLGLGLFVLAGLGAIGVGLSPEDYNLTVHSISALVAFAGSNLAMLLLGFAMFRDTRWDGYRAYSVLSGLVGLVALGLYGARAWEWGGLWADWGVGGIERLVVAPVLLWAVVVSVHLLRIPTFASRSLARAPSA